MWHSRADSLSGMWMMAVPRAGGGGGGDRFIPLRLKGDELDVPREEDLRGSLYARLLADCLGLRRRSILRYNTNPTLQPPREDEEGLREKRPRLALDSILSAPDLVDVPYVSLLHWGEPALAVALSSVVYIAPTSDLSNNQDLVSLDEATHGRVTSISWAPGGRRLAFALSKTQEVQVWDPHAPRLLRTIHSGIRHDGFAGSMAWNDDGHLLTLGATDSSICNIDLRARRPVINHYPRARRGGEVCALQWYAGVRLLSGATDGVAHVWDLRTSRSHLHRLHGHPGSVKAATWCPFDRNVLVTAGTGMPDSEDTASKIKFWHFHDGSLMGSIATDSGVWGLEWDDDTRELISAMGNGTLLSWGFRSRKKMHVMDTGLLSPIAHLTKSPNTAKLAAAQWDPSEPRINVWNLQQQSRPTPKRRAPSDSDALSIFLEQHHYYYEVVVTNL